MLIISFPQAKQEPKCPRRINSTTSVHIQLAIVPFLDLMMELNLLTSAR